MAGLRRVIFLGRKPGAARALAFLFDQGVGLPVVVTAPDESGRALAAEARRRRIPILTDDAPLYRMIARKDPRVRDIDLVISYLFWKRIREPLIRLARRGCVNFHPAPLPDYKGRAGYNTAILRGRASFGASAHFIDSEALDSGPIIRTVRFPMDPATETALTLEAKTQVKLLELFRETIRRFSMPGRIRTRKNAGGTYWSRGALEAQKRVDLRRDSPADIRRKIRAFFFPPYHGANIEIRGARFTLLDDDTLRLIHRLISRYYG